ncbi:MAG: MBL fold metallo-hydrolase [Bacteroidales bacterium]|jgi:metallo-beta-lactamase family protein|nr:MBL fold metallo-hydrolase [Bacteroidales bacterium]
MRIDFLGATEEVTGSKFLLTTHDGIKILLDCGMYQGKGLETDSMNRDLGFVPSQIDYIILSHAHIDHSGLIPYVCKMGFRGVIFCTPATRDLCSIMLPDSGKIQEADTVQFNRKRVSQGLAPVEPIYTLRDAAASLTHFHSVPYNHTFAITPNFSVQFINTGHMLGSSAAYITYTEDGTAKTLCYTGDVGRYNKKILPDPAAFPQADYIITESTYGNRLHETIDTAELQLLLIVKDACAKRKGKLIIPSFAIGRTQDIVYALHRLKMCGDLPDVEIFVDSPLAVSATHIFGMHLDCFNDNMLEELSGVADPFGFEKLQYVRTIEDSKRLNSYNRPCVIISASGMMEAGRVKHHLANNIENPKTTILSVGYCAPTTLGAKIMRGDPKVSIFGVTYKVRATLASIESFSGHADYEELIQYLSCQEQSKVKKIFIIHGEEEIRPRYAQHLHDAGFHNCHVPHFRETVWI